jgi:maltoporin
MRRAVLLGFAMIGLSRTAFAQDPGQQPDQKGATTIEAPRESAGSIAHLVVPGDPGRFEFGSYGRVGVASDLRGGTGRPANVVSFGTRIDANNYAELELRREDDFKHAVKTKVVATLAFFDPFFHFSGNVAQAIALRNLYAQGTIENRWTLWAGSRMYRGDDIYLLNWWPLDNQNTIGGGASWTCSCKEFSVAAHVGMQRLDRPYQTAFTPATAPFGVGATNVLTLDRPRIIETLKATKLFRNLKLRGLADAGFKLSLYGEAHEISAGVFHDAQTNQDRALPDDYGFLVGAQLGFWTGVRDTHINLFVRHARGLAAYDPLDAPQTFANDRTTAGSTESTIALGGNWERGWFGLLGGAYLRAFRDGDPSPVTTQKYDEGTIVLRPQVFLGDLFGVAVEGSFQARRYALLNPVRDEPLVASMWRFGFMPYFSPSGRGSYKRPQLRLLYLVSYRNQGARTLYATEDVFSQRDVEHYLGISAEWWFNSSSYP